MRIRPEITGSSIILVGSFNPPIFNPDWLIRKEVLGAEEGSAVNVEVIHRDISSFKSDWFDLKVMPDRFQILSETEPLVRIQDFVVKVFKQYLPETPILKVGLNRQVHFAVRDWGVRDLVGERLAPKGAWGEWASQIMGAAKPEDANYVKKHGGLVSLTMVQRDVGDREAGHVQAKVQPSVRLPCGIYVEVNDHYDLGEGPAKGAAEAMAIVERAWDDSMKRSEWIVDQVMALTDERRS